MKSVSCCTRSSINTGTVFILERLVSLPYHRNCCIGLVVNPEMLWGFVTKYEIPEIVRGGERELMVSVRAA